MYCTNCGSMMDDRLQACPCCKAPNPNMYGSPQFHGQVPPPYFYNNIPSYYYDRENAPAETGLIVLSALIPLAGLIIGCICLGNNEKRAGRTYLLAAGIRFGAALLIAFMFAFLPLMFLFH